MTDWRKKFAVFLLLLLPLQALAASLSALTCHTGVAHHGMTSHSDLDHGSAPDGHVHDHSTPHEHDGDASADHSGHLNCHHVFSAMPVATVVNAPSALPAFDSSLSLLYTLFVPERPQRPPRV